MYGSTLCEETCGLNVHNISHIVYCVKNWGTLWAYLCFLFESFNGEVYKVIHENENKTLENEKAKDLLKKMHLEILPKKRKFFVKTDNIPPSHAKELSRYLKIEEHHLRRMDISKSCLNPKKQI